ncbi:hypothetical protein ACFORG_01065 [Lutimaribacter marinistellae]|uniref:Major facilitator superfamily (MFS) profile domain-containing protein n=1 Tax=Lutimaribacter marinistellae TaxID=1820329 RepID=A0ABV7TAQ0_9RHOB
MAIILIGLGSLIGFVTALVNYLLLEASLLAALGMWFLIGFGLPLLFILVGLAQAHLRNTAGTARDTRARTAG